MPNNTLSLNIKILCSTPVGGVTGRSSVVSRIYVSRKLELPQLLGALEKWSDPVAVVEGPDSNVSRTVFAINDGAALAQSSIITIGKPSTSYLGRLFWFSQVCTDLGIRIGGLINRVYVYGGNQVSTLG